MVQAVTSILFVYNAVFSVLSYSPLSKRERERERERTKKAEF